MHHALSGLFERLARDHAIPIAAIVSLTVVALAVIDADRQLRASAELGRNRTATVAQLAAEEVAAQAVADGLMEPRRYVSSWNLAVNVVPSTSGPRAFEFGIDALGRELRFACEVVAGAAPVCFASPLTWRGSELPAWVASPAPCAGGRPTLASVASGPLPPEVNPDADLALLHLPTGTDLPDFVWRRSVTRIRVVSGRGGVKVVPGDLWVPAGEEPLVFVLDVPMTVHVAGNLYLGRSILVEGPGTLTLTAGLLPRAVNAVAPIEGEGHLHLGLPVRTPSAIHPAVPLEIGAHLVLAGDCVVRVPTARLHGALALGGAFQRPLASAALELTGLRLANVDRTRIPGFATEGPPRPGHLRPLAQRYRPPAGDRQKTLSFAPDRR